MWVVEEHAGGRGASRLVGRWSFFGGFVGGVVWMFGCIVTVLFKVNFSYAPFLGCFLAPCRKGILPSCLGF